jgi:hypothetical protein
MPEIKTAEDLRDYLREEKARIRAELKAELKNDITTQTTSLEQKTRWESALGSVKTDPVLSSMKDAPDQLAAYLTKRVDLVADYKAKRLTEAQVIAKGIEGFKKELIYPILEKTKADQTLLYDKKKRAGTVKPSKAVDTTPSDKKLSPEEIIAQVQSELGPAG